MNVKRYTCHQSLEDIEIDDTVDYIIYLKQGHYQVKKDKAFELTSSNPCFLFQLSQKFQIYHLFSCKIMYSAKNAFKKHAVGLPTYLTFTLIH